jgi:anti-sigma regulatory factor (Ser/Thr protein kinase)
MRDLVPHRVGAAQRPERSPVCECLAWAALPLGRSTGAAAEGDEVTCERVLATAGLPVPAGSTHVHLDVEPEPRSVARARHWVQQQLPPMDDEARAATALLTSELVTNAVVHAATPVRVAVVHVGRGVAVLVTDHSPDHLAPQPPSDSRAGGRGIDLVRRLADRWGVCHDDEDEHDGKTVWFALLRATT